MVSFARKKLLLTKSMNTLGGAVSTPASPLTRSIASGPFVIGSKSPCIVCEYRGIGGFRGKNISEGRRGEWNEGASAGSLGLLM